MDTTNHADRADQADRIARQRALAAARARRLETYIAETYIAEDGGQPVTPSRVATLIGFLALAIIAALGVVTLTQVPSVPVTVDEGPAQVQFDDSSGQPGTRHQAGRPDGWFDPRATPSPSRHDRGRVR